MIAALLPIWGPASRNWRFLFAAAELNVAPAECFVVEGSPRRGISGLPARATWRRPGSFDVATQARSGQQEQILW